MPKSVDALIVGVLTRPNWDQIWSANPFSFFATKLGVVIYFIYCSSRNNSSRLPNQILKIKKALTLKRKKEKEKKGSHASFNILITQEMPCVNKKHVQRIVSVLNNNTQVHQIQELELELGNEWQKHGKEANSTGSI